MSKFKWCASLLATQDHDWSAWETLAEISGTFEFSHAIPRGQSLTSHQLHLIAGALEDMNRTHGAAFGEPGAWYGLVCRVAIGDDGQQQFVTSVRLAADESMSACIQRAMSEIIYEHLWDEGT